MKYFLLIALHAFSVHAWCQDFVLEKPDLVAIRRDSIENPNEEIYIYLKQTYGLQGGRTNERLNVEFEDPDVCSFNQKFGKGINYFTDSCGEANGLSIILTFPKANLNSVRNFIEAIHTFYGIKGVLNRWNKDKTVYSPDDDGAGCYYEIKEDRNKTKIEIYCGC